MCRTVTLASLLLAALGLHQPVFGEVCGAVDASETTNRPAGLIQVAAGDCDVYWQGTLPTSQTPAIVKVDRRIDDLPDSFKGRVVQALQDADQALVKLGPSAAPDGDKPIGRNVYVIFTPLEAPNSLAWEERNGSSCFLVVPPIMWQNSAASGAVGITMAHELFHCVQDFSLPFALSSVTNDWWSEGSAEWFGILAQPTEDRTGLARNYERFADDLALPNFRRPGHPVGERVAGENAWPFFAWYSEKHSAHEVVPFLNQLPARTHTPEMIARELSHRDWGEFAQRYAAFSIWMTGLGAINPRVRHPQPVQEIGEGRYTIERPASHMIRERVRLEPGRWSLHAESSRSNGSMYYSRTRGNGDPDGNWVELATRREVKTVCGEPLELMIAGYGSDPESRSFSYIVEKMDDTCDVRCDSIPATRNACVVGTWEVTNHSANPADYGEPITIVEFDYPPPTYSFGADGRYAEDHPYYRHDRNPPGALIAETISHYTLNGDRGYWGSEDSSLATCAQQDLARSFQVMVGGGERHAGPLVIDNPIDPPLETQFDFECDGDTLTLRHDSFPGDSGLILRRVPSAP